VKAELFILNYNGAAYIANTIRTMLISVARSSYPCHLTVIDNVSTDESVALIRERFPSIQTNRMKENRVLCSFNEAVKQSEADIVFLLNNDLTADPDFIDPLINTFLEKKDALKEEIDAFIGSVQSRTRPLVSGEEALEALKLARQITEHIQQKTSKHLSHFMPQPSVFHG